MCCVVCIFDAFNAGHAEFLLVRSDWHFLFDRGDWMLVPEVRIIEELKKIYLTDNRPTCNLREVISFYVG